MDKKKFKLLERAIKKLKDRIIKHRQKCKSWQGEKKPCFDCHLNTLTNIERALEEARYY